MKQKNKKDVFPLAYQALRLIIIIITTTQNLISKPDLVNANISQLELDY